MHPPAEQLPGPYSKVSVVAAPRGSTCALASAALAVTPRAESSSTVGERRLLPVHTLQGAGRSVGDEQSWVGPSIQMPFPLHPREDAVLADGFDQSWWES